MSKTGTFTSFRDFTVISELYFLPILTLQKMICHFLRSWRKFDLKTCIAALNPRFFIDLLYLVT